MKWFICIHVLLLLSVNFAFADTFRCGSEVVTTGDPKIVVVQKCGKPHWREVVATKTEGGFASGSGRVVPGQTHTEGTYGETTVTVEKWYYDCGSNYFIYALTFEGDILKWAVSTSQRGSGKYECGGE